jgi:pyruvate-formate lyase-activating enzyme
MVDIRLKNIIDESFQDYKKPFMMLATCQCDWKCLKEQELDIDICQNSELSKQKNINISIDNIVDRYINNSITKAIVIGGLEPLLQFNEVLQLIKQIREKCEDDIVIYTGYYPDEIEDELTQLKHYKNIIIKFGRYLHNDNKIFDNVLGVWLVSSNQFACKIS